MFSQSTEYALRAAVWLAENEGHPQTTHQIAEATRVPAPYLAKMLQALSRAKLVRGARGVGGGFELTRPAGEVSILDIVNAVDPIRRITSCPLDLAAHRLHLCPLHKKLDDAIAVIETSFATTYLADVLGANSPQKPLCEFVEVALAAK
ncbi:MAG: Rrf2 family transcriptional regulator [Bryobacterales bacterium]|nr:Rrf2 family transcriptional regulator [Bryobacterales bacterium]